MGGNCGCVGKFLLSMCELLEQCFRYVANEVMGDCQVIQTLAKEKKRAVEESLKEENLDTSVMEQGTQRGVCKSNSKVHKTKV